MSQLPSVTASNFQDMVLNASEPVLVDFFATWCPPCKMLGPILDQLSREYAGRVKFVKVNTDEEPGLLAHYQIQGVPTLILFRGGMPVDKIVGVPPQETLRQKLDQLAAGSSTSKTG